MEADRRAEVWAKTGGRCWYCGTQTSPWKDFHVEHSIPRSKGGTDALENLVPSCSTCNTRKHDRDIEEFRGYLQTKAQHTFWFEHAGLQMVREVPQNEEEEEENLDPDIEMMQSFLGVCLDFAYIHPTLPLVMISMIAWPLEWDLSDSGDERVLGWMYLATEASKLNISSHELLSHLLFLEEQNFLFLKKNESEPERTIYEFRIGFLRLARDQAAVSLYEQERETP